MLLHFDVNSMKGIFEFSFPSSLGRLSTALLYTDGGGSGTCVFAVYTLLGEQQIMQDMKHDEAGLVPSAV